MDQISATGQATTLVHFEWEESIACMPAMREFYATAYHPAYHRTNDPRAVHCPACERTAEFKSALVQSGGLRRG